MGRIRLARAAVAAALVGLLVLAFTGPGARARTFLGAAGVSLVPYAYRAIHVEDATSSAPDAVVDGYQPANAVDGSSSRSWAVTWTDREVPIRCGTSDSPALVLRFAELNDISRVILNAGLDQTDSNRSRQVIPRVVDVRSDTGDCTRLDLTQTEDPQEFETNLPGTIEVRVQVVDVHPRSPGAETPQGDQLAALSEVRFYSG